MPASRPRSESTVPPFADTPPILVILNERAPLSRNNNVKFYSIHAAIINGRIPPSSFDRNRGPLPTAANLRRNAVTLILEGVLREKCVLIHRIRPSDQVPWYLPDRER